MVRYDIVVINILEGFGMYNYTIAEASWFFDGRLDLLDKYDMHRYGDRR
jgi:hypothetical protein